MSTRIMKATANLRGDGPDRPEDVIENDSRLHAATVSLLASLPAPGDLVELPFMRTALIELVAARRRGRPARRLDRAPAARLLRPRGRHGHLPGPRGRRCGRLQRDARRAGRRARLRGRRGARRPRGARPRRRRDRARCWSSRSRSASCSRATSSSPAPRSTGCCSARARPRRARPRARRGAAALALAATLLLGRAWTAAGFDPAGRPRARPPACAADRLLLGLIAVAAVAALPAVGRCSSPRCSSCPAATARLLTATSRAAARGRRSRSPSPRAPPASTSRSGSTSRPGRRSPSSGRAPTRSRVGAPLARAARRRGACAAPAPAGGGR